MSSPIEEAAVAFIAARRKKLDAKKKRNELFAECKDENEATCSFLDDNEETWCERCKAAKVHSVEFQRRKDETANAVKTLERRVRVGQGFLFESEIKILLALDKWKADRIERRLIGPGTLGQTVWGHNPHRRKVKAGCYALTGGKILNNLKAKGLASWATERDFFGRGKDNWGWALTSKGRDEVKRLKAEGYDLDKMIEKTNAKSK